MKKSKMVTIGLLTLSLTSCEKKKSNHPTVSEWNRQSNGNAYISSDSGNHYHQTRNGYPFWLYYYMFYRPGRGFYYAPTAVYRNRGYSTGFGISSGGKSFSSGSVRGGFGSSGRAVGA